MCVMSVLPRESGLDVLPRWGFVGQCATLVEFFGEKREAPRLPTRLLFLKNMRDVWSGVFIFSARDYAGFIPCCLYVCLLGLFLWMART